jgi:hypothetical protein
LNCSQLQKRVAVPSRITLTTMMPGGAAMTVVGTSNCEARLPTPPSRLSLDDSCAADGAKIAVELALIGADGPSGEFFSDTGGRYPW